MQIYTGKSCGYQIHQIESPVAKMFSFTTRVWVFAAVEGWEEHCKIWKMFLFEIAWWALYVMLRYKSTTLVKWLPQTKSIFFKPHHARPENLIVSSSGFYASFDVKVRSNSDNRDFNWEGKSMIFFTSSTKTTTLSKFWRFWAITIALMNAWGS